MCSLQEERVWTLHCGGREGFGGLCGVRHTLLSSHQEERWEAEHRRKGGKNNYLP